MHTNSVERKAGKAGKTGEMKAGEVVAGTGGEDTLYGGDPASAGIPMEHSVLEKEPEGPFSVGVHCSQKPKIRISWHVAISPVTL